MINIINYPNDYNSGIKRPQVFARNNVNFKLEGTDYKLTAGVKSTNIVQFDNGSIDSIPNGSTLRMEWNGNNFLFEFVESPTAKLELPSNSDSSYADQAEYAFALRNKLAEHYELYRDFELIVSSDPAYKISLVPRKFGPDYAITFTESITNFSTTSSPGQSPTYTANYSIRVEVFVEQTMYANDFLVPEGSEKDLVPGDDERVLFSVHDVLRPYLEDDIPSLSPVAITTNTKSIKRFTVRAGERTISGGVANIPAFKAIQNTFIAVNGGVSRDREHTVDWNDYVKTQSYKFLTNMPRNVLVHKQQPIFLTSWLGDLNPTKVTLMLYYNDNTSEEKDTLLTDATSQQYFVNLPAGYTQLGIDGLKAVGKEVIAYDLTFRRQNTVNTFSETIQFEVNQDYYPSNHFFLFRNTYGFWDSVWCAGDASEKANVRHDEIERKVDNTVTTNAVINTLRKVNPQFNNSTVYETNYRKSDYIRYLKEMLGTERIFKVVGGKLYEGLILTDKADLPDDSQFEDSFSFEFSFGKEVGI
jgi:hypothetical protein